MTSDPASNAILEAYNQHSDYQIHSARCCTTTLPYLVVPCLISTVRTGVCRLGVWPCPLSISSMAMTNEADFVSKTLKEVDDICTRYENILSRLESRQEEDEEERFQLKEATKTVIANLEKHAVLKMKETVSADVRFRVFGQLPHFPDGWSLFSNETHLTVFETPFPF